jgi:acetyl-CoA C-acetyltransferase
MRKVAVAGIGFTKVGEPWDRNFKELFAEATLAALRDANHMDIDQLYVANMMGAHLQGQLNMGAIIAEAIGKPGLPAVRIEAGQASGGVAFHEAVKAVSSGINDWVLVGGVEKMSDLLPEAITSALVAAEEQDYTAYTGVTKTGLSAILHRLYSHEFGATPEEIGWFAARSHDNAVGVAHAQYPFKLSIERVMTSPMEADPIRMMECAAVADGAAAVLLGPADKIEAGIEVIASTVATDRLSLAARKHTLTFEAVKKAAAKAYEIAEVEPKDIDVLEVTDDTTIDGVLSIEDLGFVEKGKGAKFVAQGATTRTGEIPTNNFGGLKARGNPVGATGLYQIAETVLQLRGKAGANQIPESKIGMAQSMAGVGSTCAVAILRRV